MRRELFKTNKRSELEKAEVVKTVEELVRLLLTRMD